MRRKEKVDNLNRIKLQNLEHSQYANYVLTQFKALKMDKIDEVLPPLATAIKNEDEVLNLPAGAEETADVRQLDDVRDQAFRSLSLKIQTALVSDDADERAAGKKLDRVLDCYPGLATMNYEKETGAVLNLLVDLKDAKVAAEVTKLALAPAITRLEKANEAFSKVYYGRYESYANAPQRGARVLRERTDEALDDVLWRVECLYEVTRDAKLLHAIELYNTYVADRERVFADRERANAAALETARKKIGEMLAPMFLALRPRTWARAFRRFSCVPSREPQHWPVRGRQTPFRGRPHRCCRVRWRAGVWHRASPHTDIRRARAHRPTPRRCVRAKHVHRVEAHWHSSHNGRSRPC